MTAIKALELQVKTVPLAIDVELCRAAKNAAPDLIFRGRVPSPRRDLGIVTLTVPFMDGMAALARSGLISDETAEKVADDLVNISESIVALKADALWFSRDANGLLRITARDAGSPTSFGSGSLSEVSGDSALSELPEGERSAPQPAYLTAMELVAGIVPRYQELFGEAPTQDTIIKMVNTVFIAEYQAFLHFNAL